MEKPLNDRLIYGKYVRLTLYWTIKPSTRSGTMAFRSYMFRCFCLFHLESLLRATETFSSGGDATSDQRLDVHPINEAETASQHPPQSDSSV